MGGAQSVATRHITSCFGKPARAPYLAATGSGDSACAFYSAPRENTESIKTLPNGARVPKLCMR